MDEHNESAEMNEGAGEQAITVEELLQDGYEIKIEQYIKTAWAIFQKKPGEYIGFTVVMGLIHGVASLIPCLGSLGSLAVAGPLSAGYFIVTAKILDEQEVSFGDFFKGFDYFVPLLLASLVSGLLVGVGMILLLIPGIYLAVSYSFANMLIVDRGLEFWDAMEISRKVITKNWFMFFVFCLVLGLVALVGMIALCVGILVAAPVIAISMVAAYDDILGIKKTEF